MDRAFSSDPKLQDRNKAIIADLQTSDLTLGEVGKKHGISTERVRQIVRKWLRCQDARGNKDARGEFVGRYKPASREELEERREAAKRAHANRP